MNSSGPYFKISEEHNCPMYTIGDRFFVSGKAFPLDGAGERSFVTTTIIKTPDRKDICKILIGDLNSVYVKYENLEGINRLTRNCSGCSGVVRLEYVKPKEESADGKKRKPTKSKRRDFDNIGGVAGMLYIFPIFQNLDHSAIKELLPLLKIKKFAGGSMILSKGEKCKNLYIIVGGRAEIVREDGAVAGVLERGAVFGEISLLTGSPVKAGVRASEFVTALMIYGKDFQKVLMKFPPLQMYFAKLLAERLAESDMGMHDAIGSGMSGNVFEMKPSELLQTLNLNNKTGVLAFMGKDHDARTYFKKGKLVAADYNEKKGADAFFEILRLKNGRFMFTQGLPSDKKDAAPIGDFMYLLMEGIRLLDEDSGTPD